MTSNQLARQSNVETQRANLVREQQNVVAMNEAARHNVAVENENRRHNLQMEELQNIANTINAQHLSRQDTETARHNVASESLSGQVNAINQTHLSAMDAENFRHNYATEVISSSYNTGLLNINQQNADTNVINANTQQRAQASTANVNQTQAAKNRAETTYTTRKTEYMPWEIGVQVIRVIAPGILKAAFGK